MGPVGSRRRAWIALASALPFAVAPRTRAEGPAPARPPWRLSALTLSFADSFLGLPRTRLNDDNGFVADLRLGAELSAGDRRRFRIVASQQVITERGGLRRVDNGKLYVEWRRAPGAIRGLSIGWTAGLNLVGDLGGSQMQNWAHRNVVTGRVLGGSGANQLQDQYPGRTEVLALVGGQAGMIHPLKGPWSLRAGATATVGAGTGAFGELLPYVAAGVTSGNVDLEVRVGAGSYWTSIRPLTMPGGYVTGLFQVQPSARLVVTGPRWLPVILGLHLEWNPGNTRQHVGAITVGARF